MRFLYTFCFLSLLAFSNTDSTIPVSDKSVEPGTEVSLRSKTVKLEGKAFQKGDNIKKVIEKTLGYSLPKKVALISVVPSIDTPVCETQTHMLGENQMLNPTVTTLTISRDLPTAQKRFAEDAKLNNVTFLSDYKEASFGKETGLLLSENQLLTRALLVLDKEGKLRYYQIVPDVATLPNMAHAVQQANELAAENK